MRIHIITAALVNLALPSALDPPCCRDHIGTRTCQRLQKSYQRMFSRRCNSDAEFRLIQCCTTCNLDKEALDYDAIATALVSEQCSDRYGEKFCSRYVNSTDVYEPNRAWTCDGRFPQIAFRACRKSCGYCDFSVIEYNLENAVNSCKKKEILEESQLDAWDIASVL